MVVFLFKGLFLETGSLLPYMSISFVGG